ncbi:MAG: DUF7523 family protein [Halanaeroarchaeum sp.]
MTSLAAATRKAVDAHPFVRDGLRAGILNFAAAARFLDVDGGDDAVATALRRYAEDLPDIESRDGSVRVTMESGIGETRASEEGAVLRVGETTYAPDGGSLTAIQAVGDVDARLLGAVSVRLATADVDVYGAGLTDESLLVIVDRLVASTALEIVEDAAGRYR